ncbi:hypothetical protein CPB84DRAFT_1842225 [Gymnopilus junonius]|uniref:Phorbol-ester/DAG-type domain-containing protein n=1 Tax=Gymnopilus junonius TaxID=109634 RepID=A0A9P5TTI4_GYMJU|nr:hypothetical protein CPB84DRAFT_1842225 [Gymnopilus junonius]
MSDGRANRAHLSLNTDLTIKVYDDPSQSSLVSPSNTTSFEQLSPTARTPHTPIDGDPPTRPNLNSRARNESRKLLSHVLLQLANRKKPESILDTIASVNHDSADDGIGALGDSLREAFRMGGRQEGRSERRITTPQDDSDDENADTSTTDETYDLMVQLLDVLTLSVAQGWPIFDESSALQGYYWEGERDSKIPSRFRRPRSVSKRSRSPSPSPGHAPVPGLLSLCISILKSVVSEDCRYRVALPRPSRPPNSLQVLTLNIAQFLVHTHRHSPQIISQIAFAMIPAFYTFSPSLYTRLLFFFKSSIINTTLEALEHLRDPTLKSSHQTHGDNPLENPFSNSARPEESALVSIQIDEVHGESPESRSGSNSVFFSNSMKGGIQSTNNPRQSPSVYYLAFLIPPLLTAMLDFVDHSTVSGQSGNSDDFSTQFISMLRLIASSKRDAYNDLLEIIAYRGAKSRRMAIASLTKLWPKSVGHAIITRPFCLVDGFMPTTAKPFAHQFMPWHFESVGRVVPGHVLHDNCRSCLKVITGFGLLCPFCMTAAHFDCYDYPEGNYEAQYSMTQDPQIQRIAMCRFSIVQINGFDSPSKTPQTNHIFEPVNWFTLSLCFICKKPLWGCFAQGLKCANCPFSLHQGCIPSIASSKRCGTFRITSDDLTIQWNALRASCLDQLPILQSTYAQLKDCTYEEISIIHGVLRTQLQILINGIEFGSVVIQDEHNITESTDPQFDKFELHQVIDICEQLLASDGLAYSPLMQQYFQDSGTIKSKPSIMHNWSFLEYMTAAIKTSFPQTHPPQTQSDLLTVDPFTAVDDDTESITYPFESARLSHIRDMLAIDFSLRSDHAAQFLINQLHHLSLLERVDSIAFPFEDIVREKDVECIFPLPLGLDLSMNVETLVSSIEASLEDLDLSSNEFGFLLLTRRFWPNTLASEYGLRRLATKVVWWILNEDDSLATVLREFLAKKRSPPGIHTDFDSAWPVLSDAHLSTAGLPTNGSDYISARRSLLSRFALPWLLELHDLHPVFYCQTLFDTCLQSTLDADSDEFIPPELGGKEKNSSISDKVLRSIIKFYDEINKPIISLPRLWVNDSETTQRSSYAADPVAGTSENVSHVDPLGAIYNFANQSPAALSKSLSFLANVVKSGIFIPTTIFRQFSGLVMSGTDSILENANLIVKAIALSLWLRSFGRQDLQGVISTLHVQLAPKIVESLLSGEGASTSISIIRYSLAACLRLCGCERSSIVAADMMMLEEVQQLPLRQRADIRGSGVVDPVTIEAGVLIALQLYMSTNIDDISGYEVDNFILRNGKIIAQCAWMAYDIQHDDVAIARINILLRTLLIDPEHFHEILHTNMDPTTSSPKQSINRLFRMVSDVTNPAFNVEGRQWRSSVSEIFFAFFSAMWADDSEEIRTTARSSVAALLPGHFEVISQCLNESLTKAPINERTRLVSFLLQLRPQFPNWKTNSSQLMMDQDLSRTDPDLAHLRVSIILLSLQMIADGLEIDSFSIMKLKTQFVQIAGFSRISVIPTHNGQSFQLLFGDVSELSSSAYPCIEELAHLIDAPHYSDLPYAALGIPEDKTANVLIGSTFLDVSLSLLGTLQDLSSLPVLTLKCLLEALYIIIHKYDFGDALFGHLQPILRRALLRVVELLSTNMSYEIRQLSLSIAQAAIKNWHSLLGPAVSAILELVAIEVASETRNSQDSLVVHGKLLIGNTLQSLCNRGLLMSLMRRQLQPTFFMVLNQVFDHQGNLVPRDICDALLRDTLTRAVECDSSSFQSVVQNISHFMKIVYSQGYSSELIIFCGQQLTSLVRRMSDGTIEGADASPLIEISVVLLQNHKRYAKDFLPYVDTLLRVALNRLYVDPSCLTRLIEVASAFRPKNQQETSSSTVDIINILIEILSDGLRMKTKVLPLTIKCLIDTLIREGLTPLSHSAIHSNLLQNINEGAYIFLQNHAWREENTENDFQAALATGKLLLRSASEDSGILQKIRESRLPLSIRSWNVLLLVTLQEGHSDWMSMMNIVISSCNDRCEPAHIAMKGWLILVNGLSHEYEGREGMVSSVWNELWPAYEEFLTVLETEAQAGLRPTLISLTSTSVADLFLFIHSLKISLALDTSAHILILNRLQSLNHGESSLNKISRAIRNMTESPSDVVSNSLLMDQLAKEQIAAEKIRLIDSKRDNGRIVGDNRHRRDAKLAMTSGQ